MRGLMHDRSRFYWGTSRAWPVLLVVSGCTGLLWRASEDPPPVPGTDAGMVPPGVGAGDPPDPPPMIDAGRPIAPPPVGARSEANVFFIGHSLINHDMPAMLDGRA